MTHQSPLYELDQRLRGERFDKPARLEKVLSCVENVEQNKKRQEIKGRTHWTKKNHEVADQLNVPMVQLQDKGFVYLVGWYSYLRQIVEKIIQLPERKDF